MKEDVRIYLNHVELTDDVRMNNMFPKFVPIDYDRQEFRLVESPDTLGEYSNGIMVYEPVDYIPDVANKYFYREDETTRLFYYEQPENVTWGSYTVRFGTPITFV